MITLGGISLSNDIYLEPAHGWTGVTASVERSLGGNLIIWESEVEGGESFDLVCLENMGWIPYWTETFTVRFRNEDSPVLEMTPIIPRKELTDDSYSYFYGKIKLLCL
jgi:hypothetical protein